jgi:hypothetical protein
MSRHLYPVAPPPTQTFPLHLSPVAYEFPDRRMGPELNQDHINVHVGPTNYGVSPARSFKYWDLAEYPPVNRNPTSLHARFSATGSDSTLQPHPRGLQRGSGATLLTRPLPKLPKGTPHQPSIVVSSNDSLPLTSSLIPVTLSEESHHLRPGPSEMGRHLPNPRQISSRPGPRPHTTAPNLIFHRRMISAPAMSPSLAGPRCYIPASHHPTDVAPTRALQSGDYDHTAIWEDHSSEAQASTQGKISVAVWYRATTYSAPHRASSEFSVKPPHKLSISKAATRRIHDSQIPPAGVASPFPPPPRHITLPDSTQ